MRTSMLFSLLLVLLLGLKTARAESGTAQAVDGFAAVVNQRIITVGDVRALTQAKMRDLASQYSGRELDAKQQEVYREGLELLIEQALAVEDFDAQKLMLPDRIINDRINQIIFENFDNDRARFLTHLVEEQTTLEEWRKGIRESIIFSELRRAEVTARIQITPDALRRAYDRNKARYERPAQVRLQMITLRQDAEAAEGAAREQAILLRGKMLAGESFAELAKAHSRDARASEGGLWGWVTPGDYRAELREALQTLPLGEVSEPIITPEAVYLVRVEERREASVQTLEQVQPELEKEVRRVEADRLYRQWISRLKGKYVVRYY